MSDGTATNRNGDGLRTSEVRELISSLTHLRTEAANCHTPGTFIGKYAIQRILGCLGQATLVLAFDPDLHRQVVLKLYHSSASGQHRIRMFNEGRALARIDDACVASCHGVEEFAGQPYLVLEFVEGKSLQTVLAQRSLSFQEAVAIFRQIVQGLSRVHEANLLHRDLKPANVMVKPDGHAKLIDFGLVQSVGTDSCTDDSGTPAYMAPERLRRPKAFVDQRSDIFGAGAILYEMLCGVPPFAAPSNEQGRELARKGKIESLARRNPKVPPWLAALCMKCVAVEPADRFHSASELLDAVERLDLAKQPSPLRRLFRVFS